MVHAGLISTAAAPLLVAIAAITLADVVVGVRLTPASIRKDNLQSVSMHLRSQAYAWPLGQLF